MLSIYDSEMRMRDFPFQKVYLAEGGTSPREMGTSTFRYVAFRKWPIAVGNQHTMVHDNIMHHAKAKQGANSDNITIKPKRGTDRAYTLDRLQRDRRRSRG